MGVGCIKIDVDEDQVPLRITGWITHLWKHFLNSDRGKSKISWCHIRPQRISSSESRRAYILLLSRQWRSLALRNGSLQAERSQIEMKANVKQNLEKIGPGYWEALITNRLIKSKPATEVWLWNRITNPVRQPEQQEKQHYNFLLYLSVEGHKQMQGTAPMDSAGQKISKSCAHVKNSGTAVLFSSNGPLALSKNTSELCGLLDNPDPLKTKNFSALDFGVS